MASASVREVQSLFQKLAEPDSELSYTPLLSRILVLQMSNQEDMSPALIEAAKVLAHPDLGVKKVAQLVISANGSNKSDTIIMTTNSLLRNSYDSNPMIRGVALRTFCSIEAHGVGEFAEDLVARGLDDQSVYVRRMAVACCAKVHKPVDSAIPDSAITNKLYSMIRDSDPIVVVNCLSVLDELLKAEGGVVINKNIACYLLNKMVSFPMWTKIQMFKFLQKYKVTDEKEIFDVMNVLDDCLSSNSISVVCSCTAFFLSLLEDYPHLKPEVLKRASGALLQPLGSGTSETVQCILEFFLSLPPSCLATFTSQHQRFFCKHRDPAHVKVKKMNMLLSLVVEENCRDIIQEFSQHCTDLSPLVARKAVESIGQVAETFSSSFDVCLEKFEVLLQSSSSQVVANVLKVLQTLDLRQLSGAPGFVERLCSCRHLVEETEEGQAAWLWILGELGQGAPVLPSILQELTGRYEELTSPELKVQLLTTTMKVFFSQLSELQGTLGHLLELCCYDNDVLVQQQGKFYYCLLQTGLQNAKAVVL